MMMAEEAQDKDLYRWMGSIDASLLSMGKSVEALVRQFDVMAEWQRSIEARLGAGDTRFAMQDLRIHSATHPEQCPLGDKCPAFRHVTTEKEVDEDEDEKFVQWPWIRDKLMVPALTTIITLVLAYVIGKTMGTIP